MITPDQTNEAFDALGSPTRRRLLRLIADMQGSVGPGGVSVNDLVAQFDYSQPAISKQLKVLREAGLVDVERDGRRRVYRVSERSFKRLGQWVRYFDRLWDTKLDALGRHLDEEYGDDDG